MENLNQKQSEILLKVLDGKNAFITGFAGSGKSYLIEHICELLKKKNKNYAKTAMTGCAALLINGKTLHSTLGIGLAKGEPKDLIKRIRRTEGKLEYLLRLNTLIIDEVSMLNDTLFDKIAELYKIYLDKLVDKNNIWTDQVILTHIFKDHPHLFLCVCNGYGEISRILFG